jgi:hypothetical protein
MVAGNFRRVRHTPRSTRAALTAASQVVEPSSKTFKNPISLAGRMGWQTEAWEMLDRVGELRYYVAWRAGSCSKVRLVASEIDEDGRPTGKCRNPRVRDIVRAIGGNQLGAAQLIKRSVECLTVPGETFMGIITYEGREKWLAFSRDEIRKTADTITVTMPDGRDHVLTAADSIWRVWNPHPRKASNADSPVCASLDALREITRTTATIADAAKSRLLGAGIVFVPTEMSLPATNAPIAADKPGDPSIALSGAPAVRELEELLYQVARVSYGDDESFARMIPIFASVPGDQVKNINHLRLDTEFTETAIKTRNDAIARLALGLDVSPERLLGIGSSSNHWSAWEVGDNDVQMHIAPVMETVCESLTDRVLYKMLVAEGIDPDKYLIWYDVSNLTADPDNTDDATDAFDPGANTAEPYLEFLNQGDTGYDLPNGGILEWQRWACDRVSQKPELLPDLLPLLDPKVQELEFPKVPEIGAGPDEGDPDRADDTTEGEAPDTEDKDPGYDQGKRGRKSDVGKSVIVDPFVSIFVSRALELAGKRRRGQLGRAGADRLRGIKPHEYHRIMDPVRDDEVSALIRGWDDTLEDDVLALIGADREQFADAVRREVRAQLTAQVITV